MFDPPTDSVDCQPSNASDPLHVLDENFARYKWPAVFKAEQDRDRGDSGHL
jgi:hypothetical protein